MATERLGESQKRALEVLLALQERGIMQIDMSKLLICINKTRSNPLHRNNFRIAIKRLDETNLIVRGLNRSLTWSLALTNDGKAKALELKLARSKLHLTQRK